MLQMPCWARTVQTQDILLLPVQAQLEGGATRRRWLERCFDKSARGQTCPVKGNHLSGGAADESAHRANLLLECER